MCIKRHCNQNLDTSSIRIKWVKVTQRIRGESSTGAENKPIWLSIMATVWDQGKDSRLQKSLKLATLVEYKHFLAQMWLWTWRAYPDQSRFHQTRISSKLLAMALQVDKPPKSDLIPPWFTRICSCNAATQRRPSLPLFRIFGYCK